MQSASRMDLYPKGSQTLVECERTVLMASSIGRAPHGVFALWKGVPGPAGSESRRKEEEDRKQRREQQRPDRTSMIPW